MDLMGKSAEKGNSNGIKGKTAAILVAVSYTHLRAHQTGRGIAEDH